MTTEDEPAKFASIDALRQHRLVDDELADEIDQPVDAIEIDADRRLRGTPPPSVSGFGGVGGCSAPAAGVLAGSALVAAGEACIAAAGRSRQSACDGASGLGQPARSPRPG